MTIISDISILIVGDDITAEDLASKIRRLGYDVVGTTSTGEEAVTLAHLQQPDMVLMETHLAGAMDGIEAAQQIHLKNNLPILFLTAHSDTGTALRVHEANASGYIRKPFDDYELRSQIEMTLHKFRAENQLRKSEERYRFLAETMSQGVVHQDATGKIIAINPAARKILSWTEKEFLGRSSIEVEHHTIRENGEIFPGQEHPSMVALHTGQPVRDVIMGVLIPKIKEYRWIKIDAIPVFEKEKIVPTEVYTIFEDITAWKRSIEMQARLAAIVTSADDAIICMDRNCTVQTWNVGAEKIFGYRTDEIIGRNINLLLSPGHENEIAKILYKLENSKEIKKFESLNRKKDGTIFPVAVTVSLIWDISGKVIGSSKIVHNISERKRSEVEREATIQCLRFINASGGKKELIQSAISFFHQLSACEAVGIRMKKDDQYPYFATIGFPEDFFAAAHDQCVSTTTVAKNLNMTGNPMIDCLCGDFDFTTTGFNPGSAFFTSGGSFWCNSIAESLPSISETDKANSTGICCINAGYESIALIPFGLGDKNLGYLQINDRQKGKFTHQAVTLWKRLADHIAVALAKFEADETLAALLADLELEVQQRTFELQEIQQLSLHTEKLAVLGKLSASIAHEFNNPLQGIMSILYGVKKRAIMDQEDMELVDVALSEGQRIKKLICCLQDFNRPSSGVMAMMDVHQTLDAILLLSKNDLNSRHIVMKTNFAKELPHITAVSDQIKQVFLNLLTNATEACRNSGDVIEISTRQKGDMVAVAIKDTGIGMQAEDKEQLFRPFYTTKPEVKGIGLGLSVSYGVVKKHQGKILVKSTLGKGSTFTVLLPIKNTGQMLEQ